MNNWKKYEEIGEHEILVKNDESLSLEGLQRCLNCGDPTREIDLEDDLCPDCRDEKGVSNEAENKN